MSETDLWAGALPDAASTPRVYGMVIGIVTNNQDPDKLGRVKVKLPWLSEEMETFWARVVTPMAGANRGMYFLPEVDDEVLVAFEHGMVDFPYVIGALWNGKDRPPATNDNGHNDLRTIKSRSGHVITLDDTADREKILIRDKTGKNELVIDARNHTLAIRVEGDITLQAKGNLTFTSSSGDLTFEGQNITLKARQNCDMQAQQSCTVQANGTLALKGPKGVNINNGALEVI